MARLSERQQRGLDRAITRAARNPEEIPLSLWRLLEEKPPDEALDPKWLDLWHKYKDAFIREIPPDIYEKLEQALNSIQLIDKDIWDIRIDENKKVTFLLGAGASAPSGIPTVDKLLSELWHRARKIGRDDLDQLASWCEEQQITDIEELLTAAYISNFVATKSGMTSLLNYFLFSRGREETQREGFPLRRLPSRIAAVDVSSINFLQDTLQTLFGLLTSTMISASPNRAHGAIVDFITKHKNTSIITTNYDGCMDEAILRNGIALKGTIGTEIGENRSDAIELIKMHGSINWAYCDSCQAVREFDLLEIKEIYEKDKLSYPVRGICKKCGGERRPLLVPPLSFKFLMFPNLIDIWNSASQSIEDADYLIIVGYSFSEADTYITKIISRSMSINKNQKMIIVNIDPHLAVIQRERFSTHIDGFNEKRILSALKSCDIVLPEILDSMLNKSSVRKRSRTSKKKGTKQTS